MLKEIEEFKHISSEMESRYVEFIADTTIDLDERWEVFHNAPTDWKNHSTTVVEFDVDLDEGQLYWHDDFYFNRHQTVDLYEMISTCKSSYRGKEFTDEVIAAFKEEILSKNLGSFIYDW